LNSTSSHRDTSVVVISHNEGQHLRTTVAELLETLPSTGEVVVVDDDSSDGSADGLAADPRLRVLRAPERLGIARSRNFGAANARGDVLVFCDAHMSFMPDWLDPLTDVLARDEVGAASLPVAAFDGTECRGYGIRWRDCLMNVEWLGPSADAPLRVPMLCGCFFAMRRNVFLEVGGFDDGLLRWGYEDAELSLRLWTMGYQCVVAPGAEVRHLFRSEFPYHVEPWFVVHNILRVAFVHLAMHRIERVVANLAGNAHLPMALSQIVESDVWTRREHVRSKRRFDDSWFFERFGITAFDAA